MFNSFGATNAVQFVDETTSLTEQIEEWKKLYSIVVLVSTFPAGGKNTAFSGVCWSPSLAKLV